MNLRIVGIIAGLFATTPALGQTACVPTTDLYELGTISNTNRTLTKHADQYLTDIGANYDALTMEFGNDGLLLYLLMDDTFSGTSDSNIIYEYDLPIPYDLVNATLGSSVQFVDSEIGGVNPSLANLRFSRDGSRFFIDEPTPNFIRQFTLNTQFDITTAVSTEVFFDYSGQQVSNTDIEFSSDGTRLYLMQGSGAGRGVYQYLLDTAWDLGLVTFDTTVDPNPFVPADTVFNLEFSDDGSRMYVLRSRRSPEGTSRLYEYRLETDWDVSTAVLFRSVPSTVPHAGDRDPDEMHFRHGGKFIYLERGGVGGALTKTIFQFNIGTQTFCPGPPLPPQPPGMERKPPPDFFYEARLQNPVWKGRMPSRFDSLFSRGT